MKVETVPNPKSNMKNQLQFLAILITIDSYSQECATGNNSRSTEEGDPEEEAIDLENDTNFMVITGKEDGNCLLDSNGNLLYYRVPRCLNGVVLTTVGYNYPSYTRDSTRYMGALYRVEMPDREFRRIADSLKEADFCYSDSVDVELGILENKMLDFVYNHKGRKVGFGVCMDLAVEAYEYANHKDFFEVWDSKKRCEVNPAEIREGDLVTFDKVWFEDDRYCEHHIAVVLQVLDNGKIEIGEQNIGEEDEEDPEYIQYYGQLISLVKDSRVVTSIIDLKNDVISGVVKFYRLPEF